MKPSPGANWKERYEALRSHVLGGASIFGSPPLGLLLFSHQGMAGWMRGWDQLTDPGQVASPVWTASPMPAEPLWQQQLTAILAHMTLQNLCPS